MKWFIKEVVMIFIKAMGFMMIILTMTNIWAYTHFVGETKASEGAAVANETIAKIFAPAIFIHDLQYPGQKVLHTLDEWYEKYENDEN